MGTFALDLLLFSYLIESDVNYLFAAIFAFLFSITLNYVFSRSWVFGESERHFGTGYLYFMVIALFGALFTAGFLYIAVSFFSLNYLSGRVAVGGIIGMFNFLANYFLNFEIHKHTPKGNT